MQNSAASDPSLKKSLNRLWSIRRANMGFTIAGKHVRLVEMKVLALGC